MKHKYLDLNMGLVKENFAIVKRKEQTLWESRGFLKIRKYPVFRYRPNLEEVIMLGKPQTIAEFGTEKLTGCKITKYCPYLGTYGMGGAGFSGFRIQVGTEDMWLVYCIWASGEHILLDDRVLECHPNFEGIYHPWVKMEPPETLDALEELLTGLTIQRITLEEDSLTLYLSDEAGASHTLHTQKASDKFPEQGGTGRKRQSYETGVMSDYWLMIYHGTELSV